MFSANFEAFFLTQMPKPPRSYIKGEGGRGALGDFFMGSYWGIFHGDASRGSARRSFRGTFMGFFRVFLHGALEVWVLSEAHYRAFLGVPLGCPSQWPFKGSCSKVS